MNASLAANFSRTAICENRSPIPECIGFESLFCRGVYTIQSDRKYFTGDILGFRTKKLYEVIAEGLLSTVGEALQGSRCTPGTKPRQGLLSEYVRTCLILWMTDRSLSDHS